MNFRLVLFATLLLPASAVADEKRIVAILPGVTVEVHCGQGEHAFFGLTSFGSKEKGPTYVFYRVEGSDATTNAIKESVLVVTRIRESLTAPVVEEGGHGEVTTFWMNAATYAEAEKCLPKPKK